MINNNITNDILYKENQLETLIAKFESTKVKIDNRFQTIVDETSITDGGDDWKSKSQEAFKGKKNNYIKQFEIVSKELETQINLMKKALADLKNTENTIENNINPNISDLN